MAENSLKPSNENSKSVKVKQKRDKKKTDGFVGLAVVSHTLEFQRLVHTGIGFVLGIFGSHQAQHRSLVSETFRLPLPFSIPCDR